MKLREAMTRDVYTIAKDDTLEHAAALMDRHNVGLLPVLDRGKAIGVLTDRDVTIRAVARGFNPKLTPVSQAMSGPPIAVREEEDLDHAIDVMKSNKVARLLVEDLGGHLVGVLTASDAAVCCKGDGRIGELAAAISHRKQAPLIV